MDLLEQIQQRRADGLHVESFRYGIRLASDYVQPVLDRMGVDKCYRHFAKGNRSWDDVVKEAKRTLVYANPEMEGIEDCSAGAYRFKQLMQDAPDSIELPKNALMVFRFTLTSSRKDRDGDVLHADGVTVDPKMLLLWQHVHTAPLGKYLYTFSQNPSRVKCVSCIIDMNELCHDCAVMVDNKMARFSHGFRATNFNKIKEGPRGDQGGFEVKSCEIMEHSMVTVPANPDAEQEEIILSLVDGSKLKSAVMKSMAEGIREKRALVVPVSGLVLIEKAGDVERTVSGLTFEQLKQLEGSKGDTEGHPFRGNQYTSGGGDGDEAMPERAPKGSADPEAGVVSGKAALRAMPGKNASYYKRGGYVGDKVIARTVEKLRKQGFVDIGHEPTNSPDGSYMGHQAALMHPDGHILTYSSNYGPEKSSNSFHMELKLGNGPESVAKIKDKASTTAAKVSEAAEASSAEAGDSPHGHYRPYQEHARAQATHEDAAKVAKVAGDRKAAREHSAKAKEHEAKSKAHYDKWQVVVRKSVTPGENGHANKSAAGTGTGTNGTGKGQGTRSRLQENGQAAGGISGQAQEHQGLKFVEGDEQQGYCPECDDWFMPEGGCCPDCGYELVTDEKALCADGASGGEAAEPILFNGKKPRGRKSFPKTYCPRCKKNTPIDSTGYCTRCGVRLYDEDGALVSGKKFEAELIEKRWTDAAREAAAAARAAMGAANLAGGDDVAMDCSRVAMDRTGRAIDATREDPQVDAYHTENQVFGAHHGTSAARHNEAAEAHGQAADAHEQAGHTEAAAKHRVASEAHSRAARHHTNVAAVLGSKSQILDYYKARADEWLESDPVISVELMEKFCPDCAQKMRTKNLSALKVKAMPAHLLEGLCGKIQDEHPFRTCMAEDFGDFEDKMEGNKEGFCAWLVKQCTGHWPGEGYGGMTEDKKDLELTGTKGWGAAAREAAVAARRAKMAAANAGKPLDPESKRGKLHDVAMHKTREAIEASTAAKYSSSDVTGDPVGSEDRAMNHDMASEDHTEASLAHEDAARAWEDFGDEGVASAHWDAVDAHDDAVEEHDKWVKTATLLRTKGAATHQLSCKTFGGFGKKAEAICNTLKGCKAPMCLGIKSASGTKVFDLTEDNEGMGICGVGYEALSEKDVTDWDGVVNIQTVGRMGDELKSAMEHLVKEAPKGQSAKVWLFTPGQGQDKPGTPGGGDDLEDKGFPKGSKIWGVGDDEGLCSVEISTIGGGLTEKAWSDAAREAASAARKAGANKITADVVADYVQSSNGDLNDAANQAKRTARTMGPLNAHTWHHERAANYLQNLASKKSMELNEKAWSDTAREAARLARMAHDKWNESDTSEEGRQASNRASEESDRAETHDRHGSGDDHDSAARAHDNAAQAHWDAADTHGQNGHRDVADAHTRAAEAHEHAADAHHSIGRWRKELQHKSGRVLSNKNMEKVKAAMECLGQCKEKHDLLMAGPIKGLVCKAHGHLNDVMTSATGNVSDQDSGLAETNLRQYSVAQLTQVLMTKEWSDAAREAAAAARAATRSARTEHSNAGDSYMHVGENQLAAQKVNSKVREAESSARQRSDAAERAHAAGDHEAAAGHHYRAADAHYEAAEHLERAAGAGVFSLQSRNALVKAAEAHRSAAEAHENVVYTSKTKKSYDLSPITSIVLAKASSEERQNLIKSLQAIEEVETIDQSLKAMESVLEIQSLGLTGQKAWSDAAREAAAAARRARAQANETNRNQQGEHHADSPGIPEGYEAAAKPFNWKPTGGRGGFTARFRFNDEGRGERFFDSEFAVRGEAGKLQIDAPVDYRGYISRDNSGAHNLGEALIPGTVLTITPSMHKQTGRPRVQAPITVRIDKVEKNPDRNVGPTVHYTQIQPKARKKELSDFEAWEASC